MLCWFKGKPEKVKISRNEVPRGKVGLGNLKLNLLVLYTDYKPVQIE